MKRAYKNRKSRDSRIMYKLLNKNKNLFLSTFANDSFNNLKIYIVYLIFLFVFTVSLQVRLFLSVSTSIGPIIS